MQSSLRFYHLLLFYRTDILNLGESTLDVAEQTVGETIRRRNDRLPTSQTSRLVCERLKVALYSVVYGVNCYLEENSSRLDSSRRLFLPYPISLMYFTLGLQQLDFQ